MQNVFSLDTRPSKHKKLYPEDEIDWSYVRADGFDNDDSILGTIRSVLEFDTTTLFDKPLSLKSLSDHARSILRFLVPVWLYVLRTEKSVPKDEAVRRLKRFYEVDRHEKWMADERQIDKRILQSAELCAQLGRSRSSRAWQLLTHGTQSLRRWLG